MSSLYAITGPTGNTGSVLVDTLLKAKTKIRVIIRDESKQQEFIEKGCEVAVADLKDVEALKKAFEGVTGAYLMNPPAYDAPDMFEEVENVSKALYIAVQEANVQKVVVLSSIGAQHSSGTGNIRSTFLMEQVFGKLKIPVAFIRAGYFMENWASAVPTVVNSQMLPSFLSPLERKIPMVAAKDIGRIAGEVLLQDWKGVRIVELQGPEKYSPIDVAEAFSKILGNKVQAVEIPKSDWKDILSQAHVGENALEPWTEMFSGFNSGWIDFDGKGEQLSGRVTIEQFVQQQVRKNKIE
ncbi:hypothetical protein K7432_013899 [Basidiobolus ranarum]|uniref:NmrA-like domain-containing protein n=1 Tax=Basidiobolus ranarum TaxID=34480 RepID=A0ABR2WIG5_9FUNG